MKIQEMRKKAGLTQRELAAAAEMSFRTMQHYEIGQRIVDNARLDTLLKLCLVLDCTMEDIIEDPELKALLRKYEKKKSARK